MSEEPDKSKLPDLNEVKDMAVKLFSDVKRSINEICQTYKTKREEKAKEPSKATSKKENKEDE